ncbi:hypothetical protein DV735_g5252, partial [Chaetothyriales sp. CBS 134920]
MAPDGTGVSSHNEQLKQLSIDLPIARADLEPVIDACLSSVSLNGQPAAQALQQAFNSVSTKEDLYAVLGDLASLLSTAVLAGQTWIVTAWTLLADLSKKEPVWRQLFGPLTRALDAPRQQQCILEAAGQTIQLATADSLPVAATRPLIRLIANCCADNNVNRSTVINSPALDALQGLVVKSAEIDLVLPALYNICTDFDEPALNESGQPYQLHGQLAEADIEPDFLTKAEARMQIWPLLDLDDKDLDASGGAVTTILADLIEMASRSALFDISIILRDARVSERDGEDLTAQLSALPDYQNLFSPASDSDSDSNLVAILTQSLATYTSPDLDGPQLDTPSPLASILALLNNALCNLQRIDAFLTHPDSETACKDIISILAHSNTQKILLPALNLLNRLALSPTGAESPTNLPRFTSSLVAYYLALAGNEDKEEALFGLAMYASIFIPPSSPHYNPSVKPSKYSST